MSKVYSLEFKVRNERGEMIPVKEREVILILVPSDDSLTDLEVYLKSMKLPENIMMTCSHTKNVYINENSPFSLIEALLVKGYSCPVEDNKLYYDEDYVTYLISCKQHLDTITRKIWAHFDTGVRFELSEHSIREAKTRAYFYGAR